MSILQVQNLSHSYNSRKSWAVSNVSFEIKSKGIVGLLGSNGAGKSTTMNIICGVLNQTDGIVTINGADMRNNPEDAKKQIGFLPQDPPLYLDLTVYEYLQHCAKLRLIPNSTIIKAIEEVMEKVSVTHFRDRLLKNLSGGYRQRVGIAQAIIHRPQLVVLDEPTVGLDPNQIIEVRNLVRDIAEDRAVLFSTHILSEVDLMCKEVLMIDGGELIFNGTLESFKEVETPDTVILTALSPPSENILMEIDGVRGVEYLNSKQIRLSIVESIGITERIIDQASRDSWQLQEINYEKKSLDSVFTKLSKKPPKPNN